MSYLLVLPLYLMVFAVVPLAFAYLVYEIVMLLCESNIKRSKKEQELFN